jgi:tetratricopeptide (TPR) repeat protein
MKPPFLLARSRRWLIAFFIFALSCSFSIQFGDGAFSFPWFLAGLAGGLAVLAFALYARQTWILFPILKQAEFLWARGAPVAEVLAVSSPLALAVGEIGYMGKMLRSWAFFAARHRQLASAEASSAHLARKPSWVRWAVKICGYLIEHNWQWPEKILIGIAPDLPSICAMQAERALKSKNQESDSLGWQLLTVSIPNAADDPVFLEMCMKRALERLARNQTARKVALSGPQARALLERSMTLLLHRHNDPRLPWDRVMLADYLLKEGRHATVLALCEGLPPAYRPEDLWLTEARTFGQLGNLDIAWKIVDAAVKVHPASYPLWMEAYRIAMALKDGSTARRALDQASKFIGKHSATPVRWEYELAKSEYFFWVEGKTDAAWSHLSEVPEVYVENNRPRLTAQMLLSKKSFIEAYSKISELLVSQPNDVDLQLMQSEAMAGMEAWEALLPHLDSLRDDVRERAAFWYLRGQANKKMANHAQGREDLERAAWMESGNLRYALSAGYACTELDEHERSEQHWRRALKIEPHHKEALLRLAVSREVHHDPSSAKSLLRECLLYHPEYQLAQEMLVRLDAN